MPLSETELQRAAREKVLALRVRRRAINEEIAKKRHELAKVEADLQAALSQFNHLRVAMWPAEARDIAHELNDVLAAAEGE